MTVKCTHRRKTKKNYYQRFIIQDGNMVYFVHSNLGKITWVRERIEIDENNMPERNIDKLPSHLLPSLTEYGIAY